MSAPARAPVGERPLVHWPRRLATIAFIVVVLGVCALAVGAARMPVPLKIVGFLMAMTPAAVLAHVGLRAKMRVDPDGIVVRHAALRVVQRVRWTSIQTIEVTLSAGERGYMIRPVDGRLVFVSARLSGLDAFAYFALTCAPPESIAGAVRHSLEARARVYLPPREVVLVPEPVASSEAAIARLRDNPFYVLGVSAEQPRAEIERAGQKLLGLLGVGAASARTYATPLGAAERTADKVRAALAELRVPERRLAHELEARALDSGDSTPEDPDQTRPWTGALRACGWRGA